MKIGIAYDLKPTDASASDGPDDRYEEFDSPETVEAGSGRTAVPARSAPRAAGRTAVPRVTGHSATVRRVPVALVMSGRTAVPVETVRGTKATNHADVIQTWAGPRQLLVDGLTGHTTYQGFFMLPTQQWSTNPVEPELFDLRRVDLHGTSKSGYMLWRDGKAWPLKVHDVWVAPKNPSRRDGFLWPKGTAAGTEAWPSVKVGTPPAGEFVPAGTAGPMEDPANRSV